MRSKIKKAANVTGLRYRRESCDAYRREATSSSNAQIFNVNPVNLQVTSITFSLPKKYLSILIQGLGKARADKRLNEFEPFVRLEWLSSDVKSR